MLYWSFYTNSSLINPVIAANQVRQFTKPLLISLQAAFEKQSIGATEPNDRRPHLCTTIDHGTKTTHAACHSSYDCNSKLYALEHQVALSWMPLSRLFSADHWLEVQRRLWDRPRNAAALDDGASARAELACACCWVSSSALHFLAMLDWFCFRSKFCLTRGRFFS